MDAGKVQVVLLRYTTPQFRNDPTGSLSKLLNLQGHLAEIRKNEDIVLPILCGIIMYRHLGRQATTEVNHAIINLLPRSSLTTALIGLVGEIRSAHHQYTWSFSDVELKAHLKSNRAMVEILDAIGVGTLSAPTVTGTAKALYDLASRGATAHTISTARSFASAPRVSAFGRQLGLAGNMAKGLGLATVVSLATLDFVRINSAANQQRAEKELALRNLIRIED